MRRAMIFPGMDPYLENPAIFPGVHSRLIVYMADQLVPHLSPRYIASVGERVYVESSPGQSEHAIIPDVWLRRTRNAGDSTGGVAVEEAPQFDLPTLVDAPELTITQPYIEIIDVESKMRVVTVIELVSPSNKFAGPGRESYLSKQREVLASDSHLVEIDLLRRGPHVLAVREYLTAGRNDYDYLVCVHRAHARQFETYPRRLEQVLPRVRIPLTGDDPDVGLDIRAALVQAYEAGGYGLRIDYTRPCEPPLTAEQQTWADSLR